MEPCSQYRACGCVWDVKLLENGAIVTVYSDGVVRIWTSHQERITDPADLDFYVSQLSQYKLSSTKKTRLLPLKCCCSDLVVLLVLYSRSSSLFCFAVINKVGLI